MVLLDAVGISPCQVGHGVELGLDTASTAARR
jgi:hypothetical protein